MPFFAAVLVEMLCVLFQNRIDEDEWKRIMWHQLLLLEKMMQFSSKNGR